MFTAYINLAAGYLWNAFRPMRWPDCTSTSDMMMPLGLTLITADREQCTCHTHLLKEGVSPSASVPNTHSAFKWRKRKQTEFGLLKCFYTP